ncbi:MAG: sigma-70 family RNA polymerase sigma factor [Elusimicrobia bacterium]|nr:sigma-70 family RNA polymerase sigma factor [Elusimicrobiota bacterium]
MKTTNCEEDGKRRNVGTTGFGGKFDSLLRRCEARARGFAWALAGNPEEAEELVQEASYRALKNWEKYDPLRGFERWYLTLLKNAFLDCRRKYEFRFGIPLLAPVKNAEEGTALIEVVSDGSPGVQEEAERAAAVSAVNEAVKAMRPHHREVVKLCDFEGRAYDEAARELGIPLGTFRSRLARARAVLRNKLAGWSDIEENKEERKS